MTTPTSYVTAAAIPPNAPWRELNPMTPLEGYLSFYLSDDLSGLAVRAVTLLRNNKSDPNLETKTYGLFSTCGHGMRASIVKKRYGVIFFMTRRGGERVLAGYYRLRWYAVGAPNQVPPDFALAADAMRFVNPPIRLQDLPIKLRRIVSKRFRIFKHVDAETTAGLLAIFNRRKDGSNEYLAEIDRLERFNRRHTGYRYVGWQQDRPFSWDLAPEYLAAPLPESTTPTRASTSSPTDMWLCAACGKTSENKARLKRCPECKAMNTLRAVQPGK
jgi:hypothetical protein